MKASWILQHSRTSSQIRFTPLNFVMGTKGRSVPRVVCCAIPISRAAGQVLVVTSRKRPDNWVCEWIDLFWFIFFPDRNLSHPLFSAKRWMGTVWCAVGGCSLAWSFGRRSYLCSSMSPHLLILAPSLLPLPSHLPLCFICIFHPNSGRTRNHHAVRYNNSDTIGHIPFLWAWCFTAWSRLAGAQWAKTRMGRLCRSHPATRVEIRVGSRTKTLVFISCVVTLKQWRGRAGGTFWKPSYCIRHIASPEHQPEELATSHTDVLYCSLVISTGYLEFLVS